MSNGVNNSLEESASKDGARKRTNERMAMRPVAIDEREDGRVESRVEKIEGC